METIDPCEPYDFDDDFIYLALALGICVNVWQHDALAPGLKTALGFHHNMIRSRVVSRTRREEDGRPDRPWTYRLFERAVMIDSRWCVQIVSGFPCGELDVVTAPNLATGKSFVRMMLEDARPFVYHTSQLPEAIQMAFWIMYNKNRPRKMFPKMQVDAWNVCMAPSTMQWMYTSLSLHNYASHVPIKHEVLPQPLHHESPWDGRVSWVPAEINYVAYASGPLGMLDDEDRERARDVWNTLQKRAAFVEAYFRTCGVATEEWYVRSMIAQREPRVMESPLPAYLANAPDGQDFDATIKAMVMDSVEEQPAADAAPAYESDDDETLEAWTMASSHGESVLTHSTSCSNPNMPGFFQRADSSRVQGRLLHTRDLWASERLTIAPDGRVPKLRPFTLTAACFSVIAYVLSSASKNNDGYIDNCPACCFSYTQRVGSLWKDVRPALVRLRDVLSGAHDARDISERAGICLGCNTLHTIAGNLARQLCQRTDFPHSPVYRGFKTTEHMRLALEVYRHIDVALDLHRVPWNFREHEFVPVTVHRVCDGFVDVVFDHTPHLRFDYTLETIVLALRMMVYGEKFADQDTVDRDLVCVLPQRAGVRVLARLWRFITTMWNPALRLPTHAAGKQLSVVQVVNTQRLSVEQCDAYINHVASMSSEERTRFAGTADPDGGAHVDFVLREPALTERHERVILGADRSWDPVKVLGWPHAMRMLLLGDSEEIYYATVWMRRLLLEGQSQHSSSMVRPDDPAIELLRVLPLFLYKALQRPTSRKECAAAIDANVLRAHRDDPVQYGINGTRHALVAFLWCILHTRADRVVVNRWFVMELSRGVGTVEEHKLHPDSMLLCATRFVRWLAARKGTMLDDTDYVSVTARKAAPYCRLPLDINGERVVVDAPPQLLIMLLVTVSNRFVAYSAFNMLYSIYALRWGAKNIWGGRRRLTQRPISDISSTHESSRAAPHIIMRRLSRISDHMARHHGAVEAPAEERALAFYSMHDGLPTAIDTTHPLAFATTEMLFRILEAKTYFTSAQCAELSGSELDAATSVPYSREIVLSPDVPLVTFVNMGPLRFRTHAQDEVFPAWASIMRETDNDCGAYRTLAPETASLLPLRNAHPDLLRSLLATPILTIDERIFDQLHWHRWPDKRAELDYSTKQFRRFVGSFDTEWARCEPHAMHQMQRMYVASSGLIK